MILLHGRQLLPNCSAMMRRYMSTLSLFPYWLHDWTHARYMNTWKQDRGGLTASQNCVWCYFCGLSFSWSWVRMLRKLGQFKKPSRNIVKLCWDNWNNLFGEMKFTKFELEIIITRQKKLRLPLSFVLHTDIESKTVCVICKLSPAQPELPRGICSHAWQCLCTRWACSTMKREMHQRKIRVMRITSTVNTSLSKEEFQVSAGNLTSPNIDSLLWTILHFFEPV